MEQDTDNSGGKPISILWFSHLMVLVGLFMIGFLLGGILSTLLAERIYGISFQSLAGSIPSKPEHIAALKFVNIITSLTGFGLTSLVFLQRYVPGKIWEYNRLRYPLKPLIIIGVILLPMFASPWVDGLHQLNQMIPLGGDMEKQTREIRQVTEAFLASSDLTSVFLNLIFLALLPALLEELLFRGTLQPFIQDRVRNKHVAIWITALLFSLLHQDLLGLIPRMVMGAMLGYLVVWTGSLWSSILAHGVNNALVVLSVWMNKMGYWPTEIPLDGHWAWPWILGSVLLTFIICFFLSRPQKVHA